MSTLPRLDRPRASDSVVTVLRDGILSRIFEPGQRLDVKTLADQLGVSATPVKYAIDRLVTEGLIEVRPRSGTYVTAITPEAVEEVFEIRRALECAAAERFVERMTPEILQRFTTVVEEVSRPVTGPDDIVELERKNAELHAMIVGESGNSRLIELYRSLDAHVTIARIHARRQPDAHRFEKDAEEHRAILDAITEGDSERLVRILGDHIREAGRALVEDIRRHPIDADPAP